MLQITRESHRAYLKREIIPDRQSKQIVNGRQNPVLKNPVLSVTGIANPLHSGASTIRLHTRTPRGTRIEKRPVEKKDIIQEINFDPRKAEIQSTSHEVLL